MKLAHARIFFPKDTRVICIGNHMISSAFGMNKHSLLKKFTSAYFFQIARKKITRLRIDNILVKVRDRLS